MDIKTKPNKSSVEGCAGFCSDPVLFGELHVEFDAVSGAWRPFARVFGCTVPLPLGSRCVNHGASSSSAHSAACVHTRDVCIW